MAAMVDLSNKKSFAGSGVLTAFGIVIGGVLGPRGSVIAGISLGLFSLVAFLWFFVKGPEEVEVRFSDEQSMGFLERFSIRRTINNFYVYLRRLGLSPPLVSPLIGLSSLPISLTPGSAYSLSASLGTACICSASNAPDTAAFMYMKPHRKASIASAYLSCYLFRLFGVGDKTQQLRELHTGARILMEYYFCYAFGGGPFVAWSESKDSICRVVDALFAVRIACGDHFTDTLMAYTLQLLPTANPKDGESFNEWLLDSMQTAMLNTVSHSSRSKVNHAMRILARYGIVSEKKAGNDAMP